MAGKQTAGRNGQHVNRLNNPYAGLVDPIAVNMMGKMLNNLSTSRSEAFRKMFDPRRDIDDECGYPPTESGGGGSLNPEFYHRLFDRECIATRVVEVFPKESWQIQPLVYESADSEDITPFEQAWDELSQQLRGEQSWYQDEQGSPVWEYLLRADILAGIGHFGVLLLGIDDGLTLDTPAEGVSTLDPTGSGDSYSAFGGKTEGDVGKPAQPQGPPNQRRPATNRRFSVKVRSRSQRRLTYNQRSIPSNEIKVNRHGKPFVDMAPDMMQNLAKPRPLTANEVQLASGAMGTDAQYMGVQLSPSEYPSPKRASQKRKLLFLRAFDESLVQIVQYEANVRNPRFGQPVMYRITLNDPREMHSGIGLPMSTVRVHWSRVIHIADNLKSSEIFGVPRMRPVVNRILDLRKVYGASGEGYWKSGLPGIALSTHPQLGGDVEIDADDLRDQIENYENSLQKFLALTGMSAQMLSPSLVDPSPHITIQIEAICIQLGIPVRVFKGSERGELASSQDDASWNDRLRQRQNGYITPRIIIPFIDRLIAMGVLPEPAQTKPKAKPFSLKKPEQPGMEGEEGGKGGGGKGGGGKPGGFGGKPAFGKPPGGAPGGKPPFAANALPFEKKEEQPQEEGAADRLYPGQDNEEIPEDNAIETDEEGNPIEATEEPQEMLPSGYTIEWPDLDSNTDKDKATIGLTKTQALAAYMQGGVDAMVPPMDYLTHIMEMEESEVETILSNAEAHVMEEEQADIEKQEADMERQKELIDEGLIADPTDPKQQPPQGSLPFGKPPGIPPGLPNTGKPPFGKPQLPFDDKKKPGVTNEARQLTANEAAELFEAVVNGLY